MQTAGGGLTIRPAQLQDVPGIARVHVDAWRDTYAGLLPDQALINLDRGGRQARYWRSILQSAHRDHFVMVAEHPGAGVVGFGSGGPSRSAALPYPGEIYALYISQSHHERGLGRRLFGALSARAARQYGDGLLVWVLDGNPAQYFYESIGGRRIAERADRYHGAPIRELGYGWQVVPALASGGVGDA